MDPATDDYWRDVRLYARVSTKKHTNQVENFEHLVGNIFYDPDYQELNIVTRIGVVRKNIVGWLAKIVRGEQQPEEHASMHVADIEQLLGIYQDEDSEMVNLGNIFINFCCLYS